VYRSLTYLLCHFVTSVLIFSRFHNFKTTPLHVSKSAIFYTLHSVAPILIVHIILFHMLLVCALFTIYFSAIFTTFQLYFCISMVQFFSFISSSALNFAFLVSPHKLTFPLPVEETLLHIFRIPGPIMPAFFIAV